MNILELLSISIDGLFWSIVVIALNVVVLVLVKAAKNKIIGKLGDHSQRNVIKTANVVTIVYKIIKYVIIVVCILCVLQINGVNVSSLLTGLGIAGALAGLAVQDLCKDLIQGMRIVTDDFFSVGDYIDYKGELFRVIGLSGRTTTIKAVASEDIINICNRNITEVRKLSGKVSINIPMPYSADTKKVDEMFKKSTEEISKISGIKDCKFLGLKSYENAKALYLLVFKCNPGDMLVQQRAAQRIILDNIYSAGLEMAVNQIDIING